jgi:type I restriction enzyme S subunit
VGNKRVPEVRFAGFSEDWDERKLGDFIRFIGGATPSKANSDYWNGDIVWLSSQEVKGGYISEGTYKITQKAVDDHTTKMVQANTPLIITRSGILAKMFPITIPVRDVAINQDIKALIFDPVKHSTLFIVSTLQYHEQTILSTIVKTGTTVQSVSMPDMERLKVDIPSIEEQTQIGNFFKQLDETISLKQRELSTLKQTKQGFLQKMFPKEGETVPEVRFPGFDGDWGLCGLGNVFDTVTDYVANGSFETIRENVNSYESENYAYMLRLQDASNQWRGPWLYTDKRGYDFLKKSSLYPGDIIMSNVGSVGKLFVVPHLDKPMTLAPNAVLLRSTKRDNYFLYQMMLTEKISNSVKEKTTPGVQPKINKTDLKKIETLIPDLEEQTKIGNLFKHLDNLITLHQRELNALQATKKAFLRKMFI